MTARTSSGIYPILSLEPSAPPLSDYGYCGSSTYSSPGRGTVRPRSASPDFVRSVRSKIDESQEMEAISCLLDFSMREPSTKKTVTPTQNTSPEVVTARTFSTLPRTPSAAARPEQPPPPRIVPRRPLSRNLPCPRALLPTTINTRRPPSAALGAPPREEEEPEDSELPDLPSAPPSAPSPHSDITIMR